MTKFSLALIYLAASLIFTLAVDDQNKVLTDNTRQVKALTACSVQLADLMPKTR